METLGACAAVSIDTPSTERCFHTSWSCVTHFKYWFNLCRVEELVDRCWATSSAGRCYECCADIIVRNIFATLSFRFIWNGCTSRVFFLHLSRPSSFFFGLSSLASYDYLQEDDADVSYNAWPNLEWQGKCVFCIADLAAAFVLSIFRVDGFAFNLLVVS